MSARRVIACSTLALLVPASLFGRSDPGSATTPLDAPPSVSVLVTAQQRVKLEALPQIVQHGREVASPDAARAALTATLRPVRVGRKVQLQVQQGQSWEAVATVRQ